MAFRASAFLRHRQARWLRPDAARWVRPDAAKYLKPGSDVADVYPALVKRRDREFADAIAEEQTVFAALRAELDIVVAELAQRRAERKYNADQPRVPSGNSDGGQWTSGTGGSGRPRVYITTPNPDNEEIGDSGFGDSGSFGINVGNVFGDIFGELAREIDKLDLFDIKPRKPGSGGVRLAGKPPKRLPPIVVTREKPKKPGTPGIGHNGGPPLDKLPAIPPKLPETREGRMGFVRAAARAIGLIGRQAHIVSAYFGLLDQFDYLKMQTDMIRTANDPAETYEVLRDRAQQLPKAGYQKHHIVNQHDANKDKFGSSRIQGADNLVSVPWLKHIEISRWYQTPNQDKKFGGRSPTDYLRDKSWEEQFEVGLEILRQHGVIK